MTSSKEYQQIREIGQQARGHIGGCLRGGHVHDGKFHAIGGGGAIFSAAVNEVRDLVYAPYDTEAA